MRTVLLATDSDHLAAEIDSTLGGDDCTVLRVRKGSEVLPVIRAEDPDVVLLDMQIGSMGGVAVAIAIRQEEGVGRLTRRPVALFLDREADLFLAGQTDCDGWLIKPIDSLRIRSLYRSLGTRGEGLYEGRLEEASSR